MSEDIRLETRGRKLNPGENAPRLNIAPKRIILPGGVFGETGVGKSYQNIAECTYYTQTIAGVKNGQKALLFDTNGEYLQFPAIALNHVKDFQKVMVCRINARGWSNDQKKDGALYCAKVFKLGLYLVDDIDKWAPFEQNKDFIGLLMGGRHEGVDMQLCHQSLDMGTPIFYRNNPTIRLHNQSSNIDSLKSKASQHIEILKIAELIVNKQYQQGNNRYFATIDLRAKKIHGVSNKICFTNACRTYLIDNPSIIKKSISNLISYGRLSYKDRNSDKAFQAGLTAALLDLNRYHTFDPFHR